jgi:hypothetical protein
MAMTAAREGEEEVATGVVGSRRRSSTAVATATELWRVPTALQRGDGASEEKEDVKERNRVFWAPETFE